MPSPTRSILIQACCTLSSVCLTFGRFAQLTDVEQVFPSPIWLNYGNRISKGDFDASSGFRIDGGLKGMMEHFAVRFYLAHGKRSHVDAKHILSLGEDMGHPCPVPTIERAVQNLNRAKEIGGPGLDWSSLAIATREQAGLEPFRAESKQGKSK